MANIVDELTLALNDLLQRDERTVDSPIEVINEGGVITLTGNVYSHNARAAAAEIAGGHPGVISVINDLTVSDDDGGDGNGPGVILPVPIRPLNSSQ